MHVDLISEKFFTEKTIVADPLSEDMDEGTTANILAKRKEILSKVKQKIDNVLNPSKSRYEPNTTLNHILNVIGTTEQD